MVSVVRPLIATAFSGLIGASVMPADAAKRQPLTTQPAVERCERHDHPANHDDHP